MEESLALVYGRIEVFVVDEGEADRMDIERRDDGIARAWEWLLTLLF
jgi:hypothetical protein